MKRPLLALLLLAPLLALSTTAARLSPARQRGVGVKIKAEGGGLIDLYRESYALVVGVSDYTSGWPKLPGVKRDIEEVARALERHGFQVTKVENPDSLQLEKSFKEFIDAHGMGVETRLVFYFAGHGHTVKRSFGDEMGYIVPADAPLPSRDPSGFISKAMDMQQMETYARRIESKHALFLFDSCFSGSIFALARAVPASIGYKTSRPVRQFITSGSADEEVPDKSVFREQFVAALDGEADANRDGYVTGSELGEFLQDRVVNYTKGSQHPQYGKIRNPNLDKGDFVFALPNAPGKAAAASSSPTPLPPQPFDPAALELAFWDTIKNSTNADDFRAYLDKYPNGTFAQLARIRLVNLQTPARVSSQTASPPAVADDLAGTEWVGDIIGTPITVKFHAGGRIEWILRDNGMTWEGIWVRTGNTIKAHSFTSHSPRASTKGNDKEFKIEGDKIEGYSKDDKRSAIHLRKSKP
jgi:hypothetical protein